MNRSNTDAAAIRRALMPSVDAGDQGRHRRRAAEVADLRTEMRTEFANVRSEMAGMMATQTK